MSVIPNPVLIPLPLINLVISISNPIKIGCILLLLPVTIILITNHNFMGLTDFNQITSPISRNKNNKIPVQINACFNLHKHQI